MVNDTFPIAWGLETVTWRQEQGGNKHTHNLKRNENNWG